MDRNHRRGGKRRDSRTKSVTNVVDMLILSCVDKKGNGEKVAPSLLRE